MVQTVRIMLSSGSFWDKVADVPGCATTGIMSQTVQKMRPVLGQGW